MANRISQVTDMYLRTRVEGASQLKLVVITYEGAMRFLRQAIETHNRREYKKTCELLIRSQNFIRELRNSLDMSVDEISPGLSRIYSYMIRRLIEAQSNKRLEPMKEVYKLLGELKSAWDQIDESEFSPEAKRPVGNEAGMKVVG